MNIYIAIDGGTTNTRINLVIDRKIIDTVKLDIGAKASIGNCELLKKKIKSGIQTILKNNNLNETDVIRILASGMITSEFGLCNVEHIKAPAGINELHSNMYEVKLNDISDIPFVFIRGVKTTGGDYQTADMMRGEETELMGILNEQYGKCIYVLPGSHSKVIKVDNGKITDFSTMLTGEMIYSLSGHTILKDAVDLNLAEIDNEFLLEGYDYCIKSGINKALFKVRVLKNLFAKSKEQIYSFFMGVCLCAEIEEIIKTDAETVVIGGRSQIKNAMSYILSQRDTKKVIALDENITDNCTSKGAVKIYEHTK